MIRLTHNRNESRNLIVGNNIVEKDYFLICIASGFPICETVPQLGEGKRQKGIRTIKIFEFENTRPSKVKKCCDQLEKSKTICHKSYIPTRAFTYESYPCY